MRILTWAQCAALSAGVACMCAVAQTPADPAGQGSVPAETAPAPAPDAGPVVLDWTPPALTALSAQAAMKSNFTLDRNMLNAAAALAGENDTQTRQVIAKLNGVSVHLLQFGDPAMIDPAAVDSIRQAYHLRGWKHLVSATDAGGPVHDGKADVWLVMDGVNVRGAVVLVESAKTVALVTVAGNLSPADLLHLRGHFGIPRFDGDTLRDAQ
jgi:hypothetical protein